MSKSPSTSATPKPRRKTKSATNNVTFIDPDRRNAHYKSLGKDAMIYFLHALSEEEFKLVRAYTNLIKLGRLAMQTPQDCKIIPFPIERTRKSQSAMEV